MPTKADPDILARPQGYHRAYLPEQDRRARVLASAAFDPATQSLLVTASISNLGSRSFHGLGDFHHRYAVYVVADLYDAPQTMRTVVLGLLDRSILPGETVRYAATARVGDGFLPVRARIYLVQAPEGLFQADGESGVPVTIIVR